MVKLLSSDIDGTLIGNADAAAAFRKTVQCLEPPRRPLLCYNTGRTLKETQRLIKQGILPPADYLICAVGTVIYDCAAQAEIKRFQEVLEEGWDLGIVQETVRRACPEAEPQPKYQNGRYKSSWYCHEMGVEALDTLDEALSAAGVEVHIVYSSGRDLDILPKFANKGNALSWLLKRIGLRRAEVLVAGDTGNDAAMFLKRGIRGIVVANAQPELLEAVVGADVYLARAPFAEGVLEGLLHYGVITSVQRPDMGESTAALAAEEALYEFVERDGITRLEESDRAYLKLAYTKAVEGLRRNITPMGFSACSLSDNESRGTDENYHSVWARDGSIAVIGSIDLAEPEFRTCQRQTLQTLLDRASVTGQLPANVRIATGEPDYSGVGGICSIDSGLWVIIAFYEYTRATGDLGFLRDNLPTLQRAMDWLSAHDSNNDALLEIPEAGDWTDLFGRSYNVLYDEVLWFRANVCFGRLLEMLGEWRRAGDYLRWSGTIKAAILHKFWPSTRPADSGAYSFADKQLSLGDTNYLIAQVTPFDFDWRCDVYGNLLAFLYNVLDVESARIAFQFMWGVGVNAPWPVANLYPVVQAGDPGWRNYYTVNLLNLPHHYHNGGIWPFVGGQWVKFIHRLGLREIAVHELLRLAQLNEAGISDPWEFTEWAHGVTGRPMGKRYQAWSCSEFISACHEIKLFEDTHNE